MSNSNAEVLQALARLGLNKKVGVAIDLDTQLLRDLNIYGDVAESIFEQLRDEFNVDVSKFNFHDYFPEEFPNHHGFQKLKYWFTLFPASPSTRHTEFKPITIAMIRDAICSRVWQS
jgi:Protein of unknown function (DUF1493)